LVRSPTKQRPVALFELDRLDPRDQRALVVRNRPRAMLGGDLGEHRDVFVGGAAAAADEVQPTLRQKAPEHFTKDLGAFAVLAVLVRQASVRHASNAGTTDRREGAQVIGHERRTGGAVEADVEQIGVQQRHRQRLGILAGEHRASGFDGHRDGHRDAPGASVEGLLDTDERGLDVARVLAGLDQQVVGAAGHEAQRLDAEVLDQLVEGDAAGDGDRPRRRAHRTADEAHPPRSVELGGGLARQRRRQAADLEGLVGESVLAQHQRRRAERVGLDDVGTGREVEARQSAHDLGAGDAEMLVAALERRAAEVLGGQVEALERGAGGAVEHQDALVERFEQGRGTGFGIRKGRQRRRHGHALRRRLAHVRSQNEKRLVIITRRLRFRHFVAAFATASRRFPPVSTLGVCPRLPCPLPARALVMWLADYVKRRSKSKTFREFDGRRQGSRKDLGARSGPRISDFLS
jgi:hypothetical protein